METLEIKQDFKKIEISLFNEKLIIGKITSVFKNNKWFLKKIEIIEKNKLYILTKLLHNLLFLVEYNLEIENNFKNKKYFAYFLKIGFSLKKSKIILDFKNLKTKKTPFLYKYKNVYYNTYNLSIIKITYPEIAKNKIKLIKLGFLVPIYVDFSSIYKNIIDNAKISGVNLITTYSCNLNCIYCFEGAKKDKKIITNKKELFKTWLKIKSEIKNNFSLSFFGGEPTLNKEAIFYFTDKLRSFSFNKNINYSLKMITNGTLIDSEFISYFHKNEFSHIQFTFDGFKKTHNKVRGFYDEIFNSILSSLKISKAIGIRYNITGNNCLEVIKFLKDVYKKIPLKDHKKIFFSLGFVDLKNKKEEVSFKDLDKSFKKCIKYLKNTKINFLQPLKNKIQTCPAQTKKAAWIDLYGRKYFCERVIALKKYEIKDSDFIKNKLFKIEKFKNNNFYPIDCFSCRLYPVCGGYCYAQKEFLTNYYFNCIYTKHSIKQEILKYLKK